MKNPLTPDIFEFLKALKENNSKEWMDANRAWYQQMREQMIAYAEVIQASFAEVYPMAFMDPRKYVARINNNRRFHPDKPPYKTHFALMVRHRGPGYSDFYIHLEPGNVMLATGIYHPDRDLLHALRHRIDQRGAELQAIAAEPAFVKEWGAIEGDRLKTAPRDYDPEHPHIEWLRHKDLIITQFVSESQICADAGVKRVQRAFETAIPFMEFVDDVIELYRSASGAG